jgi:uncharacterized membrane protein YfhO
MVFDGLLFVADNWYPEWRAYDGEKELPIIRADGTFRSVPLNKGRHAVRFVYEPKTINKSLGITIASIGIWAILFATSIIFTRKEK